MKRESWGKTVGVLTRNSRPRWVTFSRCSKEVMEEGGKELRLMVWHWRLPSFPLTLSLMFSLVGNADKEHGPFKYNDNVMKMFCPLHCSEKPEVIFYLYLCLLTTQSLQIYRRLFCDYNYTDTGMRLKNKFNKLFFIILEFITSPNFSYLTFYTSIKLFPVQE